MIHTDPREENISASPQPSKATILIVEDEPGPRNSLTMILRPFYHLHVVDNAHAARRVLGEQHIDLVTLDLKLPDCQGMDLLQEIKLERNKVEVIIITGYGSLKSAMDGIRYGAAGYLLKPFNVAELIALIQQTLEKKQRLDRLRDLLASSRSGWETEQGVTLTWNHLREQYLSLAQGKRRTDFPAGELSELASLLSELLEAKDRELLNHSSRVSGYAALLADHMNLTACERKALALGSFLHDIGKIALPDHLVSKSGETAQRNSEGFKRHPEIGARMILPLQFPAEVGQIISYHHERWDGAGYPNGLQGEGIPVLARVVCIAEVFDHLVSEEAASIEEAIEDIQRHAGTFFDPTLASLFARVATECKASLPALAASSGQAAVPDS
ncbi:MAG: HD domain-containing phosphohydrolase [Nitrospiraceae bacterium]